MPNERTDFSHNPGPWRVEESIGGEGWISSDDPGDGGDIVCNSPYTDEEKSLKRWEANARLIAAAPDLLEALQRVADDYEAAGVQVADWIRAAIAKATGR